MKLKKMVAMALAAGLCLSLFTGCGSKGASDSSGGNDVSAGNEGPDDEKTASDNKEITFWNPFVGTDGENLKKLVDDYNNTDPEYKVKNLSLKEADMYAKIPTVVNSGKDIPDLNIVHAERIQMYKDNGLLIAFDDILKDFPEINADNYIEEAWRMGDIDGERYSIPFDIHNWGTYYNKELLDKYAPNALDDEMLTFDEIMEAGEKAKADDIRGIAISWMKPNFLSLFKQEGGELTENGTDPALDTDATVKAIERWHEMYEAGVTTKDGEDTNQLFLAGKLLFFTEGIWLQPQLAEVNFEWGLTNCPQLNADMSQTVNWASSHQFVMLKNDERTPEKTKGIMDFLEWIRTNSLEWAKAGQTPASADILTNEEYLAMPQSFFVKTPEEQATLNIFDYKYNGYVSEYIDAHAPDTVLGKMSANDFAAGMQKEVSDKIKQADTGN